MTCEIIILPLAQNLTKIVPANEGITPMRLPSATERRKICLMQNCRAYSLLFRNLARKLDSLASSPAGPLNRPICPGAASPFPRAKNPIKGTPEKGA